VHLGRIGIWSGQLRRGDGAEAADAAAELDELGYGTLWLPGGAGGDVFGDCERMLVVTRRAVVATGILNLWMHEPADVAAGHAKLTGAYPDRFLLGIGVSHHVLVEHVGQSYERPLAKTASYLDALDASTPPVPVDERVLAALGPKMLELARVRTAGAHPYLVTPEHTAFARSVLGSDRLLAPEQKVVLERDPATARAVARKGLALYFNLPNYTNNWLRSGFTADDLANGGSDRLVDSLVAWGSVETISERVRAHFDAGADHVCLQALTSDPAAFPREQWRHLAALI
jgi:probable F420-dependent oxidoreductase